MRLLLLSAAFLALAGLPSSAVAQKVKSEEEFVKGKPSLGDTIPDVTVYDSAGKPVKTLSLRGHHTVLVFGCLT